MKIKFEWKVIKKYYDERGDVSLYLARSKVIGGWILKEVQKHYMAHGMGNGMGHYTKSTCFIPDPNHEWEIE